MLRLIIALTTLTLLLAPPALAQEAKMHRIITVTGNGEVRTAPDTAILGLGVMTFGETAKAALAANNAAMTTLLDLLKKSGVDERDIVTSNFYVSPRYDYGQGGTQPPKVIGYDVNNMVNVTVRKIEGLGELLDASVSAGSNQITGITFMVSKPDQHLDEARKLAVADARRKAELLATAAGGTLGQLVSLQEGGAAIPQPFVYADARANAAPSAVPVAQGEQMLSTSVSMTWEIK